MQKLNTIALLFMMLLMTSCASMNPDYDELDLELTNLKLLPLQGLEQRFRLSFRLTNPNNTEFPVDGISFKLNLRGIKVATGVTDENFNLQPLSESTFDVDVSASLFGSGRVLLDIIQSKPNELEYEINAKIFTSKGLWGSIPVTRKGVFSFFSGKRALNNSLRTERK